MISLLKLFILSLAIFFVLSIHIGDDPIFYHLNKITEPYVLNLIDNFKERSKDVSKKSMSFIKQFYSNSLPENESPLPDVMKNIDKKSASETVDFFNQKEKESDKKRSNTSSI
ncbi:MAG: hypothetical protein HQK49_02010 [Oligoflexia bacterium]|nr:hypothetical protein [Oligoflexia bacterium]